ncbi:hypothetical protein PG994_010526 [Apiospora phragmitis]|uniref:HMG box domain-containing protein n=1 Tax=Apiospora phragmitis TaxID=2905665 RepID=A0ABR1TQ78_9PEZI
MPSFIGRIAAGRLASSVAVTSSSRVVIAQQLGRVAYATPGRPKKTDTGSSTKAAGRPRKTADAAAAPKAAKKTTTTKKAAAATKSTKSTKTTKTTKSKKTSPPPKPKKKKELTEKQKLKQEKAKISLEKAKLKQKALFTEPKMLPAHPWALYVTRKSAGITSAGPITTRMAAIADEFKALSQSEKEELQRACEENKLKNAAAYKAWVERHTPEQIVEAQNARNLLRRKFDYPKTNSSRKIRDDRQPKSARTSWICYFRARHGSGEFNNLSSTEGLKKIAQEWKSLSTVERQPYDDLAAADLTRYKRQVEEVLHRQVVSPPRSP